MSHTTVKIQTLTSSESQLASVSPSNEEFTPKIFKLTIDCFDEIFEYLSLKDLQSLGQTCKTMQQVAGEYFKQNYLAAEKICTKDGIYTVYSDKEDLIDVRIWTSNFNQFMPCISHYFERIDPLRYLQSHIDEFKSIKHIRLESLNLNHDKVKLIRKILPQLEVVQIKNGQIIGNFYELMLKYCEKLKSVYVQNCKSDDGYDWLLADYPNLRHLELIPSHLHVIEELSEFFALNPKVQRFSSSGDFLWNNRNEFLMNNAKLDILEIKSNHFAGCGDSIWELLKQLHLKGFYKRLFLYTDGINQDLSIKLASLPNLETLCIRWFSGTYNLTFLSNLKELILLDGLNANDAEILANGLWKLERLYVDKVTIEDILPFIRHSVKLNKIKMLPKGDSNPDDEKAYQNYYNSYYWEYTESEDDIVQEAQVEVKVENTVPNLAKNKNESEQSNEKDSLNQSHGENLKQNEIKEKVEENSLNDHNKDDSDKSNQNDEIQVEVKVENIAVVKSVENFIANECIDEDDDDDTDDDFSNWRLLNLVALDKKRRKLPGARKITIFVRDDIFLATKWSTKYGDINLKFIEMKRSDSHEWNHYY